MSKLPTIRDIGVTAEAQRQSEDRAEARRQARAHHPMRFVNQNERER